MPLIKTLTLTHKYNLFLAAIQRSEEELKIVYTEYKGDMKPKI